MEKRRLFNRRDFLRLSALAASGAALAACAPAAAPSTGQTKTEEQPAAAPPSGTTQIVLWGISPEIASRLEKNAEDTDALWQKWLVENFEAQNPGVKIKG